MTAGPVEEPPAAPPEPAPPPAAPPPSSVAEPKPARTLDADSIWASVCDEVASSSAGSALVEALTLVSLEKGIATLETTDPGAAGRARTRRRWLEERISAACGASVRVEIHTPEDASSVQQFPDEELDTAARREAANNPLVQKAMDLFEARLVRVDPPHTGANERRTD